MTYTVPSGTLKLNLNQFRIKGQASTALHAHLSKTFYIAQRQLDKELYAQGAEVLPVLLPKSEVD